MRTPSLDLLRSFLQFVESGSLSRAAGLLNVPPPTLSMQLKRLEDCFEFPIFAFQGKKKVLTTFGVSLHTEAQSIIEITQNSFENLHRNFSTAEKQNLRIGCRRELILKTEEALHFAGTISFHSMSSEEAVEQLKANKIDLAVSRLLPESQEIHTRKFFESGSHLVVHKKFLKGHSIQKFANTPALLSKTPCLTYGVAAELFREWTHYMKLIPEDFQIKYRCEDWISLLQLIEQGAGFSILPDTVRSNSNELRYFQIPRNLVRLNPYYFLYRRSLTKLPHFKNLFKK